MEMCYILLTFCIAFGTTVYEYRKTDKDLILDWTVAGNLLHIEHKQRDGTNISNIIFFGPYIFQSVSQGFLLLSLATTRVIPWIPNVGLHYINVYDIFVDYTWQNMRTSFIVFLIFCLWIYIADTAFECCYNLYPRGYDCGLGKYIVKIRFFIQFFLLTIIPVPAVRFLLTTTYCNEAGYLEILPGILCDQKGHHFLHIWTIYNTAIWCIIYRSISYTANEMFDRQPALVQIPKCRTRNFTLYLLIVIFMHVCTPTIMVIVGILFTLAVTYFDFKDPQTYQIKLQRMKFILSSCILTVHLTSVFNFLQPHRWEPFIVMLVGVIIVCFIAYRISLKYFTEENSIVKERTNRIDNILQKIDFGGLHDLSLLQSEDLGAALHTRRLRHFLLFNLDGVVQPDCKKLSAVCPVDDNTIKDSTISLKCLLGGLKTECGIRALGFHRELIGTLKLHLNIYNGIEQLEMAIETCLRICESPTLISELRHHCNRDLVQLWAQETTPTIRTNLIAVLQIIKLADRMILYGTDDEKIDNKDSLCHTPLHRALRDSLQNGVIELPLSNGSAWLIPVPFNNPDIATYFSDDPIIDATIAFPPYISFPPMKTNTDGLCIPHDHGTVVNHLLKIPKKNNTDDKNESTALKTIKSMKSMRFSVHENVLKKQSMSLGPLSVQVHDLYILQYLQEDNNHNNDEIGYLQERLVQYYTGYIKKWSQQ